MRFSPEEHKEVFDMISKRDRADYTFSGFTSKYKGGEYVQEFESYLAKYFDVEYVVALNSGTTALTLSLAALKKMYGLPLRVSLPIYTFTACPASVVLNDGDVVFHDIDVNTLCFDYQPDIYGGTDIIMPVHALGMSCDMDKLQRYENEYEHQYILSDIAQAFGARYKTEQITKYSDVSIVSFQETKQLTTAGEGGAVLTSNDKIHELVCQLQNHGEYYDDSEVIGGNYRMTEIQAAYGIIQMRRVDSIMEDLHEKALYVLKHIPPVLDYQIKASYCESHERSYYILPFWFNHDPNGISREDFLKECMTRRNKVFAYEPSDIPGANNKPENGILSLGYRKLMNEIPAYNHFAPETKFPVAEIYRDNSFWLDIHRFRSLEDIKIDLDILNDVASGRKT